MADHKLTEWNTVIANMEEWIATAETLLSLNAPDGVDFNTVDDLTAQVGIAKAQLAEAIEQRRALFPGN